MIALRLWAALLLGLVIAACSQGETEAGPQADSRPPIWEIAGSDGAVEGWMFGTIHALPDDIEWRSDLLDQTVSEADLLVVEVASLGDGEALGQIFRNLAFDSPTGPLAARIDPALTEQYEALLTRAKVRRSHFDGMESWAAALTLSQVAQTAKSENGVDIALLTDFDGREVIELEGAELQLRIFDQLPETEQRDLLNAVVSETEAYQQDTAKLARIWRSGDLNELAKVTREGILADPELYEALLANRNRAWADQLENLLSAPARPFVAVGAAHMIGKDGLPTLLEARGYSIRRIQ